MARDRRQPPLRTDAPVVPAASLLADRARVAMLWALVDGRALSAGELARAAGVGPSTASFHLGRLAQEGWVALETQGRHRYARLVNPDVAAVLEALAVVGAGRSGAPPRSGPADPALCLARSCYDHLAGAIGVAVTDALVADGTLRLTGREYRVTTGGADRFARLGVDVAAAVLASDRTGRHFARACLDWSERRYHVAGALGHALMDRLLERGWLARRPGTRALRVTNAGRRALRREFGFVLGGG
ncbi:MAG: ArsR/SmtB family transcription factor [Gemmatimonadales bacterium]